MGKKKKESLLWNIAFNVFIPALVMLKGNRWFGLGAEWALIVALLFPISYGIWDFIYRQKYNFLSIVGFASVLLTGGIGLLHLPKEWVAYKEAFVPGVIGCALLISLKTRYPLVRTLFLNESLMNYDLVQARLAANQNQRAFERLLVLCSIWVAGSFFVSALLNYLLALYLIRSEAGTVAFTEELGQLTAWSYPLIAFPCTIMMSIALWKLVKGLKELTGLNIEAIFKV